MSKVHGTIHWNELMTRDVAAARNYYENVAGWSFSTMPMEEGDYHIAKIGETMIAGMMDMSTMPGMENLPPHWFMYVAVDDVDASVTQTRDLDGQIMRDPFDVPGIGRIAIITDPSGAALGIMTPS